MRALLLRVLLSVSGGLVAGAAVAGGLLWSGVIDNDNSTVEANVPAYLGQDSFAICVDNPSGKYDNGATMASVLKAIEYGRTTPAWVGTYLENAEIEVSASCPLGPRPEDEPRFVAYPQSRFSIFVFVLDPEEARTYAIDNKDYIPFWGIDGGPDREGDGVEFVTYGIFVEPDELTDTEALGRVIGAAYGRPSNALEFEGCETPVPGSTEQNSGCDAGPFFGSDELEPEAPSRSPAEPEN